MTLRERLADWISGGALTRAIDDAEFDRERERRMYAAFSRDINAQMEYVSQLRQDLKTISAIMLRRAISLRRIAAQETPNANATVKRMAKIARDGLE